MALRHGLFVSGASAGVTAPSDARLAIAALLSGPGVLAGGAVTGSTSGPNMKYTIAAGTFVTQRGTLATDGLYVVPNDGPFTKDSGAPAPSSGTRWDLVWVWQPNAYGSDGFGDANSDPVFGVQVGVASSTPTKPYAAGSGAGGTSIPTGALVLAESLVGTNIANASLATITNVAARAFLANQSDTGWVQITNINSQYTASVAQCRVKNGELMVRGSFTRTSGAVTVGETLFGIPAGMFPTSTSLYRIPFVSSGTVSGFLALSTAGIATVAEVSGTTTFIVPAQTKVPMD